MERAIVNLEKSVEKANDRLDTVAWKLDLIEKTLAEDKVEAEGSQLSVQSVVRDVAEVKQDYRHLKRDFLQVKKMEEIASDELQAKIIHIQQIMTYLHGATKNCNAPQTEDHD